VTQLAVEAAISGAPSRWRRTRLRSVAARREDRVGARALALLSLESVGRLVPRLPDRQAPAESNIPRYLEVSHGDLVINPMWLTGGSIAVSDRVGAVSPDYRVFLLTGNVDPRFIHHLLRSVPYLEQYKLFARADTTFDRRIQQRDIDNLALALPSLAEQRRIAEFLDGQVSRVDALIAARRRQVELVEELRRGQLEVITGGAEAESAGGVRLATIATKIGSGKTPRGGGDVYASSGVAFLRSQNIHNDGLRLEDVVYIDPEIDAAMSSTRVRQGDILLNITGGSLGRCCVATPEALPANVSQHVCIVRVPRHDPEYIAASLQSPRILQSIRMHQAGGNREGLNFERVGSLTIFLPRDEVSSVRAIRAANAEALQAKSTLEESAKRLTEYKDSLITAAVTGEFDVTSTSGRSIPT